jgi:hypothetical protein
VVSDEVIAVIDNVLGPDGPQRDKADDESVSCEAHLPRSSEDEQDPPEDGDKDM